MTEKSSLKWVEGFTMNLHNTPAVNSMIENDTITYY